MSATAPITLPHGLWDGRRRRSAAELRPATGADEIYLASAQGLSRAEKVTALLGRCIIRVDDLAADDALARELTVGDREALLLRLRAATFGDRLDCTIDCPACGERMDVGLRVSQLLLAPYDEVQDRYTVDLGVAGITGEAVVRLVTGADQEAAARCDDQGAGLRELVARCVIEIQGGDPPPPLALAEALSDPLAKLDPQAQITIEATCPACDEPLAALVDAADVLFAELAADNDRLLAEVDAIARVYHWSEAEILGLDVRRRRRYLELIDGTRAEA